MMKLWRRVAVYRTDIFRKSGEIKKVDIRTDSLGDSIDSTAKPLLNK